jgi:opacity protein-like surface antigen
MCAKRIKTTLCAAAVLLACGTMAQAGEGFLAKGMYEAGVSGAYTKLDISGFDAHFLYGQGDLSYFVTDQISVGGTLWGAYLFHAGDVPFDASLLGLEANVRYHLPAIGSAIPYVGLHGGWLNADINDSSQDAFEYGAHAGMKFPITANVFFDTQVKYTRFDLDDLDIDADLFQLVLGIRYYFGEGADVSTNTKSAQPRPFQVGDIELGFGGSYNYASIDVDDSGTLQGNLFWGQGNVSYYVTDQISVGVNAMGIYLADAADVTEDIFLGGTELMLRYNFSGLCRFVPYVGIHGGYLYADMGNETEYAWEYGAHGGVKYLLTDTVFFDTQLRYTELDLGNDNIDVDIDALQFMVGIGFRL